MHESQRFQRRLGARILALLGAAWLVAPEVGCRGSGSHATGAAGTGGTTSAGLTASTGGVTGAGGGAGGAGGSYTPPLTRSCFQWPLDLDAGQADAGQADAGQADAGQADAGPCPVDPALVLALFQSLGCPHGFEPGTIASGPVSSPSDECCYMCELALCGPGGRPYLAGGKALVAAAHRSAGADGWREGARPRVDDLTAEARAHLAAAWTGDALHEHASVASFSRAALALLAAGAPAELLALTHRAALDEVRHAQRCFALASAYAGEAVGPGPFPLGAGVAIPVTLAEMAASAAGEGCVGETVAAVVAAEQLARATDPAVRAALAEIAGDEARHAELAWRTVAWAVQVGGAEARTAVAHTFAEAIGAARTAPDDEAAEGRAVAPKATEAHGRLDRATVARVTAVAMADIVIPAVWTLLHPRERAGAGVSAGSSLDA